MNNKAIQKYLGIDYGKKRVGLALADEETRIATPFEVYENDAYILRKIIDICVQGIIKKIVVGFPLNFQMQKTPQTLEVEKFIEELKKAVSCPIETENEVFTSKISRKTQGKKSDSSSAALILQSWLDKNR